MMFSSSDGDGSRLVPAFIFAAVSSLCALAYFADREVSAWTRAQAASAWTLTSGLQALGSLQGGEVIGCALDQGDYPVQAAAGSNRPRPAPPRPSAVRPSWLPTSPGPRSRSRCTSIGMPRSSIRSAASVVRHNDVLAWTEFLMLPRSVLRQAERGGKKHRKRAEAETKRL